MGDNAERLHFKCGAAMMGYWEAGYMPKKLLARTVHKSEVQVGCWPHYALRPRPELAPSYYLKRVSFIKLK